MSDPDPVQAIRPASSSTPSTAGKAAARGAAGRVPKAPPVSGPPAADAAPTPAPAVPGRAAAGLTISLPFASASLRLPAPGAVATVGPVRVTLPTGALYYGGLAALAVLGTVEAPVAAGAALAGAVLGRRWLRRPVPRISLFDSTPLDAR